MKKTRLIRYFSALFTGVLCLSGILIIAEEKPADPFSELRESKQKVDSLNKYIGRIYTEKPAEAKYLGKQTYLMAKRLQYLNGQKDALYTLSNVYKLTGSLDTSDIYIDRFLELAEKSNDTLDFANGYYQKGNILRRRIGSDTAEYYYLKSRELFRRMKDDFGLLGVSNALKIISKNRNYYNEAVYYFHDAFKY